MRGDGDGRLRPGAAHVAPRTAAAATPPRWMAPAPAPDRTLLHAMPRHRGSRRGMRALFWCRPCGGWRPATEHKGQVDGDGDVGWHHAYADAGATPTARQCQLMNHDEALYLPCPCVQHRGTLLYVRALAVTRTTPHQGASDGSKVPPNLVVGCLFLYRHGLNTGRAGSLPSVP